MSELLPCANCGGEALMQATGRLSREIRCKSCCISLRQKVLRHTVEWLEQKMAETWNTRTHPSEALPEPVALSAAAARVPDGYQLVPKSALRWLFGEEGKFQCPESMYFSGMPPKFWWRSIFRKMIEATPPSSAPVEEPLTHQAPVDSEGGHCD